MSEEPKPTEDLSAEFRALGENLTAILRAAWESQERKKLQQEIESGMAEVASALSKAGADFISSPAGQRLQEELRDVKGRVESGQVETRARAELLAALQRINAELSKAIHKTET